MTTQQAQTPTEEGVEQQVPAGPQGDPLELALDPSQPETGIPQGDGDKVQVRTYTQDEVAKIQSTNDQRLAQVVSDNARLKLERQIEQAQRVEDQYAAMDATEVEAGTLTSEAANQRRVQRRNAIASQVENQRKSAEQSAAYEAVNVELEKRGRLVAAQDYAKEYGVDVDALLHDKSLTSPDKMEAAALKIALQKSKDDRPGTETFDSGRVGQTGVDVNSLSPDAKIVHALKNF